MGRRSKRAKDKQTNKKSLFGQKQDLRRVRALARTCQEPRSGSPQDTCTCGAKWHQNSAVLGELYLSTQMGACLLVFRATRFTSFRAKIRGPRGILCTRGEKAHTSKRVSIIACNNVISKVQCATWARSGFTATLAIAKISLRRQPKYNFDEVKKTTKQI